MCQARVQGFGSRASGVGCRVWGIRLRAYGLLFKIFGLLEQKLKSQGVLKLSDMLWGLCLSGYRVQTF